MDSVARAGDCFGEVSYYTASDPLFAEVVERSAMYTAIKHIGPRAEYRDQQSQRVVASPSLAEKFSTLKSLTVNVEYYAPEGMIRYRQFTYDVNLDHVKSVFRPDCCNDECIQGDHELTEEIANAVAKCSTTAVGELCCHGWENKASIKKSKCNHVLRYRLKLGY